MDGQCDLPGRQFYSVFFAGSTSRVVMLTRGVLAAFHAATDRGLSDDRQSSIGHGGHLSWSWRSHARLQRRRAYAPCNAERFKGVTVWNRIIRNHDAVRQSLPRTLRGAGVTDETVAPRSLVKMEAAARGV